MATTRNMLNCHFPDGWDLPQKSSSPIEFSKNYFTGIKFILQSFKSIFSRKSEPANREQGRSVRSRGCSQTEETGGWLLALTSASVLGAGSESLSPTARGAARWLWPEDCEISNLVNNTMRACSIPKKCDINPSLSYTLSIRSRPFPEGDLSSSVRVSNSSEPESTNRERQD